MARNWMHTVQAHSPIYRQIGSTSFVEGVLAWRNLSPSSIPSSPWPIYFSPPSRMPAVVSTQRGQGMSCPISVGAVGFARHHHFKQLSTSGLVFSGIERAQISTVACRATAEIEVGVGSGSKNEDREILVQHLLLPEDDAQLIDELQRQVAQEGLDLSDLAEEHSICPSKAQGGMLGWLKLGQTDPIFEEAAFNAPLNKLVKVHTKHGMHLLQVLNERKSLFLKQIQVEQFHDHMQEPSFVEGAQLIDVREPHEIATAAIKGFEAYPLSQFGEWAPNIVDDLDPEKDTYILCHHGMRSMQAANWLKSQGFKRLYNIVGGINAYSMRVDNSIPTY